MRIVIIEDTRNKIDKTAYIREQLESEGYQVVRNKLYIGDYTFPVNQSICVDTKQNMNEIEGNLIHDHERFKRECVRAKEAGIQLVILIQDPKIKEIADVFKWWNPRLRFNKKATKGRTLAKIMISMESKYSVRFEFCTEKDVGKTILKILGGD